MRLARVFVVLCGLFAPAAAAAQTCGAEGCAVPLGTYRVVLPETQAPSEGYPALLFFHGAGQSGTQALSATVMVDAFRNRGWAVIAPDGLPRPDVRNTMGWSFLPESVRVPLRDEMAFTRQVLDDAARRHGIDRGRVLMSGFSIGGSLVWYLACRDPGIAAAYAPVAGAFWRPHPAEGSCAGPVRMLHTHGWRDETVPLEGRPLRGGAIYQGDVFHGLGLLRAANGCDGLRADAYETEGAFWRRQWTRCTPGSALELALHTGGHSVPIEWADMAIGWFDGLEATE